MSIVSLTESPTWPFLDCSHLKFVQIDKFIVMECFAKWESAEFGMNFVFEESRSDSLLPVTTCGRNRKATTCLKSMEAIGRHKQSRTTPRHNQNLHKFCSTLIFESTL